MYWTFFTSVLVGAVVATVVSHWRWPHVTKRNAFTAALGGAFCGTIAGHMLIAIGVGGSELLTYLVSCYLGVHSIRQLVA